MRGGYSRSPIWESHVVSEWLPRFGDVAAPLNWSDRTSWGFSVEALLIKRFCLASVNFKPTVIVLRGFRRPMVLRFFYAFNEAKQGRTEYLALLEGQMFGALGHDSPTRLTSRCSRRGPLRTSSNERAPLAAERQDVGPTSADKPKRHLANDGCLCESGPDGDRALRSSGRL